MSWVIPSGNFIAVLLLFFLDLFEFCTLCVAHLKLFRLLSNLILLIWSIENFLSFILSSLCFIFLITNECK